MRAWTYTQYGFLTTGITEEGLPYFEKRLQGWNDPSDREDLVVISAFISNEGKDMVLENTFSSQDAYDNPQIRKKGEELEQIVLQEVNLWLNGAV